MITLENTILKEARFVSTTFGNMNLSEVIGLAPCEHSRESFIPNNIQEL